jgi:hypothetical protein
MKLRARATFQNQANLPWIGLSANAKASAAAEKRIKCTQFGLCSKSNVESIVSVEFAGRFSEVARMIIPLSSI